jgi:hypothetical protein
MTRFLIAAILFVGLTAQTASAQFGSVKVPSTGGGGLSAAEIDKFLAAATVANTNMTDAEAALYPLVVSKEKADEYNRKLAAALAIPDVKERDAKVAELKKAAAEEVQKIDPKDPAVVARLEKATPDQKSAIKDAIQKFLTAAGADVALALQGKKLVTQKPDLTASAKVPELTQAVKETVGQATAAVKLAGNLQKLATTAKIDIPADSFAKITDTNFDA